MDRYFPELDVRVTSRSPDPNLVFSSPRDDLPSTHTSATPGANRTIEAVAGGFGANSKVQAKVA